MGKLLQIRNPKRRWTREETHKASWVSESETRERSELFWIQSHRLFQFYTKVKPNFQNPFGQTLLLARCLVEAGVGVIQANMRIVQNGDMLGDHFPCLKRDLLPPLDRAVGASLDELQVRG